MIVRVLLLVLVVLAAGVVALAALRARHNRHVATLWTDLHTAGAEGRFDPSSVAELPAPARRYLTRAIAPGTPLARSVEIAMVGRIGLDSGAEKMPFRARQVLAVPGGMVWQADVGSGPLAISGDDRYGHRQGVMRWYVAGIVPVVRAGGRHVTRSAAGRLALEAPLLLPSALVPGSPAAPRWEAVDSTRPRVHLAIDGEACAPVIEVDGDGRLRAVEMERWDAEGPDGRPGYIPWRGEVVGGDELSFDGYTIPARIEVTRHAGTPRADTFFEAEVRSALYR